MSRSWFPFRRKGEDTSEIVCEIDFNLDDRPSAIRALVERIQPLLLDRQRPWHLDLTRCGYLGPHAGALLIASLLDSRKRGQPARISLPEGSKQLRAFCEVSGLLHYVTGSPFPTSDHPANVTIPIRAIMKASFSDPDPIVGLIRKHVHVSEGTEEYLRICINEVLQNVEDHAMSSVGALVSARFMKDSQQVRVAIVDRGLGIATTLRKRYSDVADAEDALGRVVKGGYSAKSRPNNMGVGVSNLCLIVQQMGGEIFIVSEDGYADGKAGRQPWAHSLNGLLPGTGVFFIVPVMG